MRSSPPESSIGFCAEPETFSSPETNLLNRESAIPNKSEPSKAAACAASNGQVNEGPGGDTIAIGATF